VLLRHALTISLYQHGSGAVLKLDDIITSLRDLNPAAQHQERTWKIYAERMTQWLSAVGLLETQEEGWKLEDKGEESINPTSAQIRRYYSRHPRQYRENTLFIGDTSPHRTVRALGWLLEQTPKTWKEIETKGHRNGSRTLLNLRIIRNEGGKYRVAESLENSEMAIVSSVFHAALKEPVMDLVMQLLVEDPTANTTQIGITVAAKYERDWTEASQQRIGSSLKQWGTWLLKGKNEDSIPKPPGRASDQISEFQMRLLPDND
jgi:hypothetical protein